MVKRLYNKILRKIYLKLHKKFVDTDLIVTSVDTGNIGVIQYRQLKPIDDETLTSLISMQNGLGPLFDVEKGKYVDVKYIASNYIDDFVLKLADSDYFEQVLHTKIINDKVTQMPLFIEMKLLNVIEK